MGFCRFSIAFQMDFFKYFLAQFMVTRNFFVGSGKEE